MSFHNCITLTIFQVVYPDGEKIQYPTLKYRKQEVSVPYCNTLNGVNESADSIAKLLTNMCLSCKTQGEEKLMVEVPPTR